MKFKNRAEAGQAYKNLAMKMNDIYQEADDGSGNIDLMQVKSHLEGDMTRRKEMMLSFNSELADIGEEVKHFTMLENGRDATGQAMKATGSASKRGLVLPGSGGADGKPMSLGRIFVESDEWTNYWASIAPNGRVNEKAHVSSPPVAINAALVTGGDTASGGAMIIPGQTGIVVPFPMRQLTILDIITMGQTDSDAIEFVRVTDFTNNAAGVAESTATADPVSMDAAHGVKPESELALERIHANVQAIAHWIPATKRALSDASQIRTMIDNFLQAGLREELENQVINGSGTGEEIEGFDTALTLTQPYSATVTGLNPQLETTRKALTKIQLAKGILPTAYVFHPADWETIELARLEKNFTNDASSLTQRLLHGVPVVINQACPEGFAFLGDFRQYVVWDREQTSISVSDSHANFFIRNMVAILAEMRAAGGLLRTDAICRIALSA